jgi:outer membrane lipopolysaccharide assembly protein LptE/RlpB
MNRSMRVMAVGLLGLVVLLTGCGFHLQGSGAVPMRVHVLGDDAVLTRSVHERLRGYGAEVVLLATTAELAYPLLELSGTRRNREASVLAQDGQVQRFTLQLRTGLRLVMEPGERHIVPLQVRTMVDAADLHTASQIREQVAWQQLLDDMTKLIISHVKHTTI